MFSFSMRTNALVSRFLVFASSSTVNVGVVRKVFPHLSQKTITHHCLPLFPIISQLGYRTNWHLGLGELLHAENYSGEILVVT